MCSSSILVGGHEERKDLVIFIELVDINSVFPIARILSRSAHIRGDLDRSILREKVTDFLIEKSIYYYREPIWTIDSDSYLIRISI
jgi:hypothetical protein